MATPTLVLLIVVAGGIFLRITPHFLAVVEVFAFGFDQLVGFSACEAGEDVLGHGVVFGDTCSQQEDISSVIDGYRCWRDGGRQERKFENGMGQDTIGFFVLLVFPHGFEACGTSEDFMTNAALVIWLRSILSVDILVGLRGVV